MVFRRSRGVTEVALGEQRDRLDGGRRVRLPKGKLAPGESPEQAARREVAEETGLRAQVVARLGAVAYRYREGDAWVAKRVDFFLMELEPEAEAGALDGEFERVLWCPIAAAAERLSFASERGVVERARARLEPS